MRVPTESKYLHPEAGKEEFRGSGSETVRMQTLMAERSFPFLVHPAACLSSLPLTYTAVVRMCQGRADAKKG